jgi:hypothetical protein
MLATVAARWENATWGDPKLLPFLLAMPSAPTQPVLDHVAAVIRPALRNYLAAETALTDALKSKDADAVGTARQNVMLAARQAVDVLHHLADFVLKEPSPALGFAKIEDVRSAVEANCVFVRSVHRVADVRLLRDVADAFKHHRPDRPSTTVVVSTDVVPVGSGWSKRPVNPPHLWALNFPQF